MQKRNRRKNEGGVIVVFLAILLLAFILFVALVVDIGRILASQRQLLNAADTASLTGANLFRINTFMSIPTVTKIDQWKQVKKAVLASLNNSQIFGCDNACLAALRNSTVTFPSGAVTGCDDVDFSHEETDAGNMHISVQRGIFCRETPSGGVPGYRHFFSLERSSGPVEYCYANAVRVRLKLTNINSTFAKILGVTELHTAAFSESYVTPEPVSCLDDNCDNFGVLTGSGATATFVPFSCTLGPLARRESCACPDVCTIGCTNSCCGRYTFPANIGAVCGVNCPESACGTACGC